MPPNIDLATFSDGDFDPKRWINDATDSLSAGIFMERYVCWFPSLDHLLMKV